MDIAYFEVTSDCLEFPAYYAAYAEESVFLTAQTELNSDSINIKEIGFGELNGDCIVRNAGLTPHDVRRLKSETNLFARKDSVRRFNPSLLSYA